MIRQSVLLLIAKLKKPSLLWMASIRAKKSTSVVIRCQIKNSEQLSAVIFNSFLKGNGSKLKGFISILIIKALCTTQTRTENNQTRHIQKSFTDRSTFTFVKPIIQIIVIFIFDMQTLVNIYLRLTIGAIDHSRITT